MIRGDETLAAIPEETPGRRFLRWRPTECKVKLCNFCFKYATHKKRIHSKRNTRHSNPPPASNRVQSCVGSSCLLNFNAMQCYNVFSATNVLQCVSEQGGCDDTRSTGGDCTGVKCIWFVVGVCALQHFKVHLVRTTC